MWQQVPGWRLRNFPYRSSNHYVIDRAEHNNKFARVKRVQHARRFIPFLTLETALFIASALCFLLALTVVIIKQDSYYIKLLNLTITEIAFLICGMCCMFCRQWLWLQRDYQHIFDTCNYVQFVSSLRHDVVNPRHLIVSVHVLFGMLEFGGFVLFIYFDTETYTQLKSTIYFTANIIFLLVLFDGLVCRQLCKRDFDQFSGASKLVIHELKEELVELLIKEDFLKRKVDIEYYLNSQSIFKVVDDDAIYYVDDIKKEEEIEDGEDDPHYESESDEENGELKVNVIRILEDI